jgi:hypothetical protein
VLIVDDSSRPEGPVVYQIDYSNTTALGPTSATIHRVAGGGCNGPPATPAEVCLGNPLQNTHSFGIEYDGAGGFYLADTGRHIIRHFTTTDFDTATSSIVAGINGTPGSNDGPATAAGLTAPFDVALSPLDGALFISDAGNCRVRRVLNGIVDTIAGSACTGSLGDGGLATSAVLTAGRLAPSASGLYVADPIRGVVRLVDMTSVVSGPPAYTQSESADFTIASLDTADHILCSIDSDNNYSACDTQPHTVSKPEGSHTLYAATGSAPGFLFDPTPAKWTWTVDHSPPDAFLITDPAEGATGVTTVPTITWTAANDTYSGVDHYELTVGGVRNGGDVGCCALDVAAPLGEGQHNITVRAVDKAGNYTDTATRTFDVGSLPVASFSIAPNPVLAGGTVTFTSTATDADGPIARYEWDLDGDGTYETDSGANASASRAYPTAGSLTIAHRVTDSAGRAAETTGRLTVSAAAVIPQQFGMTVNNGAQYTNDPNVTLNAVFPSTITSILASNDGGFLVPASFAPAKEIKWKLDSSGPERLPKTVYMRFLTGVFTSETYTDDIILDETPPKVSSASVASATSSAARAAKTKKYTLKLKASDSNSGVAGVQITANKKKAGKLLKYKTKLSVKASSSKLYVRAKDKAGNYSKWRAASRKRGG